MVRQGSAKPSFPGSNPGVASRAPASPDASTPGSSGSTLPSRGPRSRVAIALVYVVYLWGLVELGSWVALVALSRKGIEYVPAQLQTLVKKHVLGIEGHLAGRDSYMVMDSELGWTVGKGRTKGDYRSNSAGVRASREYAPTPPPGVLRLAAFGDSFIHGSGVGNPMTWEARLEAASPGLEVLNFGIPGGAPDQGLLRYRREGVGFHPHVVLIGFMSENVLRLVNTYRPFYFAISGMAFGKPRFGLRGDELVLYPNPLPTTADYRRLVDDPARELPRIGEHDYYYQRRSKRSRLDVLPSVRLAWVLHERWFDEPVVKNGVYNTHSEPFRVSVAVVDRFYREVLANGSLPVVVLFPQYSDVVHRAGRKVVRYQPLLDALRERRFLTVDLGDAFERYDPQHKGIERKFIHYTPEGNEWVARYLGDWMREQHLDSVAAVERRLADERAARR